MFLVYAASEIKSNYTGLLKKKKKKREKKTTEFKNQGVHDV